MQKEIERELEHNNLSKIIGGSEKGSWGSSQLIAANAEGWQKFWTAEYNKLAITQQMIATSNQKEL